MESIFTQLAFWHWLTFAIVLIILEMFSPGAFFLWLGIASGAVGMIMLWQPDISWQTQFVIFALLSIVSIVSWKLLRGFFPKQESEVPHLNRRAEQYLGRTFIVTEPITNGVGKINVDDSTWRVRGKDAPAGSQVKVTGVDGVFFEVDIIKKG